ncbi:MAG TPA: hypothetical protein VJW20_10425, partial [Candidatus Angelobacter sp.]|nr:hypothetical protein [Candidatus Angelobacter sp.]
MRSVKLLLFSAMVSAAVGLQAQQKTYDWIAQSSSSFRMGPGYNSGVAVYNPHGWEAVHVRLDIEARQPVTVGVVRLEDWNNAVRHPGRLLRLDYACLTEEVTRISYSCNFYASNISRVVVVRDARPTEQAVVTGLAAPFVHNGLRATLANEVRVTPYEWECVSNCSLPDPPQFAWVEQKEKFEIASGPKSYGPFVPGHGDDRLRIRVKAQAPVTVALLPGNLANELSMHPEESRKILAQSSCKQYGIESTTLDCTLQKPDGAMQLVVLPESEIRKKKNAE